MQSLKLHFYVNFLVLNKLFLFKVSFVKKKVIYLYGNCNASSDGLNAERMRPHARPKTKANAKLHSILTNGMFVPVLTRLPIAIHQRV